VSVYSEIVKKMVQEAVYLENEFDQVVMRSIPGNGNKFYAKAKGGVEYEISSTTDLVSDTLREASEITAEQYNAY
jgi:hypothetical protein